MKTAQTIDQVIAQLDDAVAWSRQRKSRLGYFAALYRRMTQEVKNGIAQGRFQDGARMEKLDVIFANRYLAAFNQRRLRRKPTQAWQAAFVQASDRSVLILQHLLLGMNAHKLLSGSFQLRSFGLVGFQLNGGLRLRVGSRLSDRRGFGLG